MESSAQRKAVSKEEVIAKLKDDGDFDRLRLKIIRKLKDNEQLRNNIISVVKQSAALNRAGTENMKPRQLSDAIYEEVKNTVMGQVSDGVWEVIRSADGMKNEITETVESVYKNLAYAEEKKDAQSSIRGAMAVQKEVQNNVSLLASCSGFDDTLMDSDPKEPPGFSLSGNRHGNYHDKQHKEEMLPHMPHERGPIEEQKKQSNSVHLHGSSDFSEDMGNQQPGDDSDEDPDVPPGFG